MMRMRCVIEIKFNWKLDNIEYKPIFLFFEIMIHVTNCIFVIYNQYSSSWFRLITLSKIGVQQKVIQTEKSTTQTFICKMEKMEIQGIRTEFSGIQSVQRCRMCFGETVFSPTKKKMNSPIDFISLMVSMGWTWAESRIFR